MSLLSVGHVFSMTTKIALKVEFSGFLCQSYDAAFTSNTQLNTHTQKHVLSHHVGATGRAFSSWHEFGLTLPSNAVAPQSLADILEQHEIQATGK